MERDSGQFLETWNQKLAEHHIHWSRTRRAQIPWKEQETQQNMCGILEVSVSQLSISWHFQQLTSF